MSITKNKALIERYFEEIWNQGNLNVLNDLIGPEYINHSPGLPDPAPGPEGLKPIVFSICQAFPDLQYRIKNMVVAADKVAVHTVMTGTHQGDFFGVAATNNNIEVEQMQIERIHCGQIVEHWRITDDATLMRQLSQ